MGNMEHYKDGVYMHENGLKVLVTRDTINGQTRIHMSVSHNDRLPTWDEMKHIREAILPMNRDFICFFPKAEDYVNLHPNCLHWLELKPSDKLNNFIDRADNSEPYV